MMKTLLSKLRKKARREDGIAVTEFGLIAPTFMLLLMGVFDVGYAGYAKGVLQGALEEAGRSASLETTTSAILDNKVLQSVKALDKSTVLNPVNDTTNTSLTITRKYYERYSDIATPEDFTDSNTNGMRDPGECFIDRNGNNNWDVDVGLSGVVGGREAGRGGAQDVVIYEASISYKRLFPLWSILGQSDTEVVVGRTILRNQPFSAQAARIGVKICT
jgi:TadE-like protein